MLVRLDGCSNLEEINNIKRLIKKAKWSIILFTSAVFVFLADILTFIPVCANDIWLNSGNKFGWTRISHVLQILGNLHNKQFHRHRYLRNILLPEIKTLYQLIRLEPAIQILLSFFLTFQ